LTVFLGGLCIFAGVTGWHFLNFVNDGDPFDRFGDQFRYDVNIITDAWYFLVLFIATALLPLTSDVLVGEQGPAIAVGLIGMGFSQVRALASYFTLNISYQSLDTAGKLGVVLIFLGYWLAAITLVWIKRPAVTESPGDYRALQQA